MKTTKTNPDEIIMDCDYDDQEKIRFCPPMPPSTMMNGSPPKMNISHKHAQSKNPLVGIDPVGGSPRQRGKVSNKDSDGLLCA